MLEAWVATTIWDRQVPEDAPRNQLQDVYKCQGENPQLDWVGLPKLFGWKLHQPDNHSDIAVATVFGYRYTLRVAQSHLWEAQCEAKAQLHEVADASQ